MSKKRKWEDYPVTNEEVLVLLNSLDNTDKQEYTNIISNIVSKLNYLIQSRIKKHHGRMFYEDLLQEGKIGLIKAIKDFDQERGVNFFKFALWHIQTKIRHYLLKEIKMESSYDKKFMDENAISDDNLEKEIEVAETKKIINDAIDKLPRRDRMIIQRRFGINCQRQTLNEIGNLFGLSRERIRQIEIEVLVKMKKNKTLREYVS